MILVFIEYIQTSEKKKRSEYLKMKFESKSCMIYFFNYQELKLHKTSLFVSHPFLVN